MNRLKDFIYECVRILACLGPRSKPLRKKILIVRVDEIGDYMLWRPFWTELSSFYKAQDFDIHFCGNQSWKSLFDTLDQNGAALTWWMDKQKFKTKMGYRVRFLRDLYRENYHTVINPTFSRDNRFDDSIVKSCKAKERIGMLANHENLRSYEHGYDRGLYTKIFEHTDRPIFEWERNRLFTAFVIGRNVSAFDTKIDFGLLPSLSVPVAGDYFVIFPGSRSAARIWPAENFAKVASHLFNQYGWTAVIAGTKNDQPYIDAFRSLYNYPFVNMAGKTSLPQMLTLLQKAKCLISVDTGSVHLATAVNCPVFGVFNGSQYKRFAPYPKSLAPSFHAIYPDDVEKELANEDLVKTKYEFVTDIPYASVKAEKMILALHGYFLGGVVHG